jgi:hypothetical protein
LPRNRQNSDPPGANPPTASRERLSHRAVTLGGQPITGKPAAKPEPRWIPENLVPGSPRIHKRHSRGCAERSHWDARSPRHRNRCSQDNALGKYWDS